LEGRVVLSTPAPYPQSIAAPPDLSQFGGSGTLSVSNFLGASFSAGTSVGGIAHTIIGDFGAQFSAGISGKLGVNVTSSVNGGTVSAGYDTLLHQDYAEPTRYNQFVAFEPDNTYVDYSNGSLATTTPTLSDTADLIFQLNGNIGGQVCVFGCGGGSLDFGANVDVPVFHFDSGTGDLSIIGVPLAGEVSLALGNTVFNALANDALSIPIAGPVSVQASINAAPSELDASLDVGINLTDLGELNQTDAHPGETTKAESDRLTAFLKNIPQATFNLATAALRFPNISLNSSTIASDGTITDTATDPVAELDIQAGALAGCSACPPSS
jgi:hypothetical protein